MKSNSQDRKLDLVFSKWRAGDAAALNELFELIYSSHLLPLAKRALGKERHKDDILADDLVHMAYESLRKTQSSFANLKEVESYIYTSMRRDLVDAARARKRRNANGQFESLDQYT